MAKKCCQIWQKVAKVAKKCYQMWQKVAKGVLGGSKRFQGLPRASKGHGLPRCSNVWFQGGFQGKVVPDVEKSHQSGSTGHGLERLPALLARRASLPAVLARRGSAAGAL